MHTDPGCDDPLHAPAVRDLIARFYNGDASILDDEHLFPCGCLCQPVWGDTSAFGG